MTSSLVEAVIRRADGLRVLGDVELAEAQFWNGSAVFFERPASPDLEELLDQVEDSDYVIVPERPDVHWRHFKRTDCIRMALRCDGDVHWKAYRGSIEFSTVKRQLEMRWVIIVVVSQTRCSPFSAVLSCGQLCDSPHSPKGDESETLSRVSLQS